jgi:calcium-dependent protein kinase
MAPEILREDGYREKCDIFSLGSVMFNLLSGRYLFNGANNKEIIQMNKECDFSKVSQYLKKYSTEASDLLFKMLESNPDKRISAEQAL